MGLKMMPENLYKQFNQIDEKHLDTFRKTLSTIFSRVTQEDFSGYVENLLAQLEDIRKELTCSTERQEMFSRFYKEASADSSAISIYVGPKDLSCFFDEFIDDEFVKPFYKKIFSEDSNFLEKYAKLFLELTEKSENLANTTSAKILKFLCLVWLDRFQEILDETKDGETCCDIINNISELPFDMSPTFVIWARILSCLTLEKYSDAFREALELKGFMENADVYEAKAIVYAASGLLEKSLSSLAEGRIEKGLEDEILWTPLPSSFREAVSVLKSIAEGEPTMSFWPMLHELSSQAIQRAEDRQKWRDSGEPWTDRARNLIGEKVWEVCSDTVKKKMTDAVFAWHDFYEADNSNKLRKAKNGILNLDIAIEGAIKEVYEHTFGQQEERINPCKRIKDIKSKLRQSFEKTRANNLDKIGQKLLDYRELRNNIYHSENPENIVGEYQRYYNAFLGDIHELREFLECALETAETKIIK